MTRTVTVALRAINTQFDASYRNSAAPVRKLGDEVSKTAARNKTAMNTLGRDAMIGGGILVAGFAIATKATADFDAKMSQVQALSHATGASLGLLRKAALDYGRAIGFSATQTADAEIELVKAGISVHDILTGGLTGALTLAAAGQLDVADATTIAASAMTQFNLEGKDVPHIADLLAAGADKALGSVQDLGQGLSSAGTVAAQMGWSLEETVGTLSEFAQNAQIGEKGGTLLRQMLLQLASPSKQAQELMDQYGLSLYDANGHMVDSSMLAGRLQASFGGLDEKTRNYALGIIFGAHAIQGANILLKDGAAVNAKWVSSVDDSGFAAVQAAAKMDNLKGDVSKLGSAFQKDLIQGGSSATGALRGLTQGATGLLNAYGDMSPAVQGSVTALVGIAGAAALAGGAMLVLVPKVAALDEALLTMTGGAVGAKAALAGVGKISLAAGLGFGLDQVLTQLSLIGAKSPDVAHTTDSLVDLAQQGHLTGDALKTFGPDFENLGHKIDIAGRSMHTSFTTGQKSIKNARTDVDDLDKSLASLVSKGKADVAAQLFAKISAALKEQGVSTKDIQKSFDDYGGAVANLDTDNKLAADSTGELASAQDNAKAKADALTKAYADQADALKAAFDPMFAVVKATRDQKDAQSALIDAQRKHGRASKEAHDADDNVLQTTIALNSAVLELQAGLAAGTTSLSDVNGRLDQFSRQGLISAAQAAHFKQELAGGAANAATLNKALQPLAAKHVRPKVTLQDGLAMDDLGRLTHQLNALDGRQVRIGVEVSTHQTSLRAIETQLGIPHQATGGLLAGPGTGTSDSIPIMASNGEFVVNARSTKKHLAQLRAMNADHFAAGGVVGGFNPKAGTVSAQAVAIVRHGGSSEDVQALIAAYDAYLHKLDQVRQREDLLESLRQARAARAKARGAAAAGAQQTLSDAIKALHDFDQQAGVDAQKAATDALLAKMQRSKDLIAQRYEIEDNLFALGKKSAASEIASLTQRMAGEKKYTDAWMQLYNQRQQILDDQKAQEKQSYDDALSAANQMLDQLDQVHADQLESQKTFAAKQADLLKQQSAAETTLHNGMAKAAADLAAKQAELVSARAKALNDSVAADAQLTRKWGSSLTWLTGNVTDQIGKFTAWTEQLADARRRGVSEQVIRALGLDEGPQALDQLRQFSNATQDQIDALNAAVAAKTTAAQRQAGIEQAAGVGQLGADLAAAQSDYYTTVSQLQQDYQSTVTDLSNQLSDAQDAFAAEQAGYADKLAGIGQEQGRSYAAALAQALNSGIPAVVAAGKALATAAAGFGIATPAITPTRAPARTQHLSTYDDGGWLLPGQIGINRGSQPEAVLTPAQSAALLSGPTAAGDTEVRVFIGDRELTDIVRIERESAGAARRTQSQIAGSR